MQEADEQDTCRICSAPAEPGQPLFHPCKCSGTIRYIHQDCLTTWLAHSKKKNCDVCKHAYAFTKVYAPDMPSSLPFVLLVRRIVQQTFLGILFVIRAMAVSAIWLGVLPWVTVWTWRMYFSMGEATAWWISDKPKPTDETVFYNKVQSEPTVPPPTHLFGKIVAHPMWVALSADIFTGQIIASFIVLFFVAVFLLREWISQNARPGVFEDEEVNPPLDQPAPPAPAPVPAPAPAPAPAIAPAHPADEQPLDFIEQDVLLQRQADAMRALNEMRGAAVVHIRPEEELAFLENINMESSGSKGKDREMEGEQPARYRRRFSSSDSEDEAGERGLGPSKRRGFSRRAHAARVDASRRRVLTALNTPSPSSSPLVLPENNSGKFDFTFKSSVQAEGSSTRRSASEPRATVFSSNTADKSLSRPSAFPPVQLQPPNVSIPFSLNMPPSVTNLTASNTDTSDALHSIPHSFYARTRRPALPTTLIPSGSNTPFSVRTKTPLESPNLATYRAPEELENEAGPGYFGRNQGEDSWKDGDTEADLTFDVAEEAAESEKGSVMDAEHRKYFGLPESGERGEKTEYTLRELSDSDETEDDEAARSDGQERERGHDIDDEHLPLLENPFIREGEEEEGEGEDDEEEDEEEEEEDEEDEDEEDEEEDEEEEDEEDAEGILMDAEGAMAELRANANVEMAGDRLNQALNREDVRAVVRNHRNAARPAADVPVPAIVPPVNQAQGGDEAINMDEGPEGNIEEDFEGAMEAIGMRGPVHAIFQNAALMIFVLDTAIGLGVWIPFTIGKSTALLSLDPPRFLRILHLPIRAMRIVTDPIVDSIAFLLLEFCLPALLRLTRNFARVAYWLTISLVGLVIGQEKAGRVSGSATVALWKATDFVQSHQPKVFSWRFAAPDIKVVVESANSTGPLFPEFLRFSEPYFAILGREVRLNAEKVYIRWSSLAVGSGPVEKVFAVMLGYVVVGFLLAIYLNLLTVGNARNAGRAVRSAVRQQLLVSKVAAFIFIELVTFPLGCGVVLDLCSLKLFAEADLQSRIAFCYQAPLTAVFYHWVAGTMFMYSFAVLLSGCRSIMRPGAMWFIKDPQDQNAHPIRDILDRPTLTQLRKICVSGLMYSFVVACVVSSVAGLMHIGSKSILPFRWRNREPLSNVPIDLLFLHVALPYAMRYFRPKRGVRRVATALWRYFAHKLRITSYFFGERVSQEEYTPSHWMGNFTRSKSDLADDENSFDGSFRRVPATDNLALPRDTRATAAVTENGEPVDDTARALMDVQNTEAEKARRNVKDDYLIVYLPPLFRYRVILFITLMWIVGACLLGLTIALPIALGRSVFKLFIAYDVHDGYSLILGFYLLWGCALIVKAIDKLEKRRQRSTDGARVDLRILVLKRSFIWAAKALYMGVFFGIIIPTLLAIVVDLYVILPIRFTMDPSITPRIRVVDQWALGLLYGKIMLHTFHANRPRPNQGVLRGLVRISENGWSNIDLVQSTKEVILPLVGGLTGMILLPGGLFRTAQAFFPNLVVDDKFIFMHVYPGIFALVGLVRSAVVLFNLLSSWSQSIRDKEFLVEMRLRNHEPEKTKVPRVDSILSDDSSVILEDAQ